MADQAEVQAQIVTAQIQQLHQPLLQAQTRVGGQPVELPQCLTLAFEALVHRLVVLLLALGVQQLAECCLQRGKKTA